MQVKDSSSSSSRFQSLVFAPQIDFRQYEIKAYLRLENVSY